MRLTLFYDSYILSPSLPSDSVYDRLPFQQKIEGAIAPSPALPYSTQVNCVQAPT